MRFRGLNSVGLILLGCLGTVLRGYCSGSDGGVVCRGWFGRLFVGILLLGWSMVVLVGSVNLLEFGLWLVLFASCFGFCLRFVSCCYSVYVWCLASWFCLWFLLWFDCACELRLVVIDSRFNAFAYWIW